MLGHTVSFLVLLTFFVVLVASCTAWVVTVLQVASVPDEAWAEARDDRRTWMLVVLLGGPVGALAFWITTWPQLAAACEDLPALPPRLTAQLRSVGAGGGRGSDGTWAASAEEESAQEGGEAPPQEAPARKALATKAPARKAPATKAPARKAAGGDGAQ